MIKYRRGEGVLGDVVRDLEYERLQNRSMNRRVESVENIGAQLPVLRTQMEFAVTA